MNLKSMAITSGRPEPVARSVVIRSWWSAYCSETIFTSTSGCAACQRGSAALAARSRSGKVASVIVVVARLAPVAHNAAAASRNARSKEDMVF